MATLLCDLISIWLCYNHGQAPGLFGDHLHGFHLKYEGHETATDVGRRQQQNRGIERSGPAFITRGSDRYTSSRDASPGHAVTVPDLTASLPPPPKEGSSIAQGKANEGHS
ncbi:Uncharacterized protein Fot_37895 [Forsythia ovata]|uniref:Secreted protein n=1 Tax=Forsythia ovata TaxID=205694 RepID=A0ABD1S2J6_9LAMI